MKGMERRGEELMDSYRFKSSTQGRYPLRLISTPFGLEAGLNYIL